MNALVFIATLDWGEEDIALGEGERKHVTEVMVLALKGALANPTINPGSEPHIAVACGEIETPGEVLTRLKDEASQP